MTVELESVKALLDAHLTALRLEIQRLANNYDAITRTVQSLENNTNVSIAEIRKDINSMGGKLDGQGTEIKAVKQRIEIGEDVQQEKWGKQEIINEAQKTINEGIKSLGNRVVAIFVTAITILLGLWLTGIWERLNP